MTFERQSDTSDDEGEALAFLRQGRKMRGLSPMQLQRINARLTRRTRPNRRRSRVPAVAAICLALLAGPALAYVVDLSRLPLVGRFLPARKPIPASPIPHPRKPPSRTQTRGDAPARAAEPETPPVVTSTPSSPESSQSAPGVGPAGPAPVVAPHGAKSGLHVVRRLSLAGSPSPGRAPEPSRRDEVHEHVASPGAAVEPGAWDARRTILDPAPVQAPITEARPHVPAGVSPTPTPANSVLAESQSFSAALAQWHRDHNGAGALSTLDTHERRFPGGLMQLEAKVLRAEILLQQGQERESLALLDSMSLLELPRGRELQTVRGELRIKLGRCSEGRRDLDPILVRGTTDALARRAARALSLCP